jgi:CubicO group peptidase (beta-lactamase class C family)
VVIHDHAPGSHQWKELVMQGTIDIASVREAIDYYLKFVGFRQHYLRVPGVQVAVFAEQEVTHTGAFGHADVENGVKLTDRHLFRVSSHSKILTAIAVLQLVERDLLGLDDTVAKRIPVVTGRLAGATVRELLSHTAGVIRDGTDTDYWQLNDRFPDRDRLIAVARAPGAAVFAPGEVMKYSNIGYALLGLIIEAATGRTYAAHIQQGITEPLGLSDIGTDFDRRRLAAFAVAYSALTYSDHRAPIDHIQTGALAPATGAYASARDLVRVLAALLPGEGGLLGESSKWRMRNPSWEISETAHRYGLGLATFTLDGRELFGHIGAFPGHQSFSWGDPALGLAASVLTNAIDAPAQDLAIALAQLVTLAGARTRPDPGRDLRRFTGRFANLWGVWDVVVLGGRLYRFAPAAEHPIATATPLECVNDTTLRVSGGSGYGALGEPVSYRFAPSGAVESLHGGPGGTMVPLEDFALADRVSAPRWG